MFVTSLKTNRQWPEFECKKKKIVLQFLVYQRHFMSSIEQADSSRVLHFPSAVWSSLVASTFQRKIISANFKAKKIIALRCELKDLKAETAGHSASSWFRGIGVEIRAAYGASCRGKSKRVQEKFHTLEKKVVERDLRSARSRLCESTFLQEFISTSALAPSLVL